MKEEYDYKEELNDVATRFKTLRQRKYSSAEQFSIEMCISGERLSRSCASRLESPNNLTLKVFFRFLRIHGVTPEEFFTMDISSNQKLK